MKLLPVYGYGWARFGLAVYAKIALIIGLFGSFFFDIRYKDALTWRGSRVQLPFGPLFLFFPLRSH